MKTKVLIIEDLKNLQASYKRNLQKKEAFHGPVVASSSDPGYNSILIKNGRTHACKNKFELPQKIIEILENP